MVKRRVSWSHSARRNAKWLAQVTAGIAREEPQPALL